MKQSQLGTKTRKDVPAGEESRNAKLLIQGGYVKKEMAGVYSYLPLGLRVLKKIEQIIVEEMESVGAQQLLMPALTPKANWQQTGRAGVDIAYELENAILGWSHEEMVTPIAKEYIGGEKSLPLCYFQIQTKFRNEKRAKSGLLRGREFLMKDAYSFHTSKESLMEYYEKMAQAYFRVFDRCGLKSYKIESGGGEFSENISHEFSVISPVGEDTMVFCVSCGFAQNTEIATETTTCPKCGKPLREEPCIEAGNIFDLGTKYSEAFKLTYADEHGQQQPVIMGCYGIGVSRLLGTIVETFADDKGLVWPEKVAPFQVHLLSLKEDETAEKLYHQLRAAGIEVLFDDRDESPGKKFADSDLLGIPHRVVVSKRSLEQGGVELKKRNETEGKIIAREALLEHFGATAR